MHPVLFYLRKTILNRYQCIKSFETKYDYYGKDCGNGGIVNEGDIYIVIREPIPKKKLYKLKKENDDSKWRTGYLYLRKNFLKRYFKKVDD